LKGPTDTTYAYSYADNTPLTYSSYTTEGNTLIATFRVTEDGSGGTLYILADDVSSSNTVSAVLKHTTVTTTTALGYSSATISYANWRKE